MARLRTLGTAAALALALAGCTNDAASPSKERSIASKLTEGFKFTPKESLFDAPLPASTDSDVKLFPLGAPPVVYPGGGGLMALEVDDPKDRDVRATLMQFAGDDSHVKVPAPDDQRGDVVENEFSLSDALCGDLCDAIFTITVVQKVELEDGKISAPAERQVVLDCRAKGNHDACEGNPGAGSGIQENESLCGDVTKGEIALSGNTLLDSHIDALRQLGLLTSALGQEVGDTVSSIATAAGIAADSSAADVADALQMRVEQETMSGLTALIGASGCAVRRSQVQYALMACDPDGVASLTSLECTGVCEPETDPSVCAGAETKGCRGLIESQACGGTCTGACQTELSDPAPCDGTCIGTCDGNCPDDGNGGCAGPCEGNCSGECRTTSHGTCDADCTGLCDDPSAGAASCEDPLAAYCSAGDGALTCPGDCFGDVEVTKGADACRKSAVSIGHCLPRCTPPLLQLSFAFQMDLDSQAQADLAKLVEDLNAPLAKLIDAQARAAMLQQAASDLAAAQEADIADALDKLEKDDPKGAELTCAKKALEKVPTWLDDQSTALAQLQDDITQLLAVTQPAP
jgi:hypothetical protein